MKRMHVSAACMVAVLGCVQQQNGGYPLWQAYDQSFKGAKYVDLTHEITPQTPVWAGFGPATFGPTVNPKTRKPYTWKDDGFEATRYVLATDQLGTQLDPPAHWNPDYAGIDELPATFAVRPLVVISIAEQARRQPGYHLSLDDISTWERAHGPIPEGAVVFIRSDWSKHWDEAGFATMRPFPGATLEAIKFLHQERHILFHGHEALDTDTTATFAAEAWLLQNGYTQAEGVANLDQVPEAGALVIIGYPKFKGGVGGYARFIAACPPDWRYGVSVGQVSESPLPKQAKPLHWDAKLGMRVR